MLEKTKGELVMAWTNVAALRMAESAKTQEMLKG